MTKPRPSINSSTQLIERATEIASAGRCKRVVVAAAQDSAVLTAVAEAKRDGFIEAVLVGDKDRISQMADLDRIDISPFKIIDEPNVDRAADRSVALASAGEADIIMKGFLPTSALLKKLLDKKFDLRGGKALSHCAIMTVPGLERMINITDGGMMVSPNRQQKLEILGNGLLVSRALGLNPVRVAVSGIASRSGQPSDEMAQLVTQARAKYDDILIEGGMTLAQAALVKPAPDSSSSPLNGQADIFLVGSIEEGNLVGKALIGFAEAIFAGVIVGAQVPLSLVSRTDSAQNKKASLALAVVLSDYYERQSLWLRGRRQ